MKQLQCCLQEDLPDMPKLSIQISVTNGDHLDEQIANLKASTKFDIEIVVINSSSNENVSKVCEKHQIKEIKKQCGLLMSRYIGANNSQGDYILILDETRFPSQGLIDSLHNTKEFMLAFPEIQKGHGFINWLDNMDKETINETHRSSKGETELMIPRFYYLPFLRKAFDVILSKLTYPVFEKVVAKDDRIIFYEFSKIAGSNLAISSFPIYHNNDTNVFKEFRKYFRYGVTSNYLIGTDYEFMLNLTDKMRRIKSPRYFPVLFLYVLRGIAYFSGLHLGSGGRDPQRGS